MLRASIDRVRLTASRRPESPDQQAHPTISEHPTIGLGSVALSILVCSCFSCLRPQDGPRVFVDIARGGALLFRVLTAGSHTWTDRSATRCGLRMASVLYYIFSSLHGSCLLSRYILSSSLLFSLVIFWSPLFAYVVWISHLLSTITCDCVL